MTHIRQIKTEDFAVVKDTERDIIVYAGTFAECDEEALSMNRGYQSTAYVAQGWNH